ncbi:MAG TPA: sugar phosphate isomerase/epimerase [Flexivirga sp.]|uniref:sugar phosphate isomerase/epimerase family protein n=1 Tax=Flexivirga sp. TaxID=1962927 RepID=UPI002C9B12A8|nr:sugar phosphate isomerase/epimerase [Flexivirga sp.]HWC23905.1 sugar phosphate isomerase/epimerase [Flexivirga sp.]
MTTRMKLALNPIQWMATNDGWLDPELAPEPAELLDQVKRAGFDHVMASVPAGLSGTEYVSLVEQAGLGLAPGYVTLRFDGSAGSAQAAVDTAVESARELAELGLSTTGLGTNMVKGSPRVQTPAQGVDHDPSRLSAFVDAIGQAAERMATYGIRPDLHPHVGTWIETEDETRTVLDQLPADLVGFLPDIGHLSWARADVGGLITQYQKRISFLHIKDCRPEVADRGRELGWGYQQTVLQGLWVEPGRGGLDIRGLVDRLPDDFDGHLMVEVDRPDIADPRASADASADWMRRAFEFDG